EGMSSRGAPMAEVSTPYWEERKDCIYLYAAREICKRYCGEPSSVIDVGSNQTPTLEWHRRDGRRLVSIDLRRPYVAEGVESVTGDFLRYKPDTVFDLVTCFQVLEHVKDPSAFAGKMLSIGKTLVVSVPYQWRKGRCKWHIHDPVDEQKMYRWF